MADSTTIIEQVSASQAQKEVTVNGLFDAGSIALMFGRHQESCVGLTWAYYGGRFDGISVPNGTLTLTASADNFISVNLATGVPFVSANAYYWCRPEAYGRLYKVVTGANSVTSYEDHRFGKWGVFPSMGLARPDLVDITFPVGDASTSLTTGTTKVMRRATSKLLLTDVRAAVATVSSSGAPAVDLNNTGNSVFGTTLTIDANEKSSTTAATPFTFAELGDIVADDDELTLDVDTAGTSAAGLVVVARALRGIGDRYREFQGLLLQMTGSNGGTTWTDLSPTPKTVTRIGSTVTSTGVTGPFGGASTTLFDGTGDGLSVPYSADLSFSGCDFTLSGWAYNNASASGNRVLVDFNGTSGNTASWAVYINATNRGIAVYNGPTAANIITSANNVIPAAGNWWHWMVVRSSGTVYVFVDGALVGSATYAPPVTHSTGMRIGCDYAAAQSFYGNMRDLVLTKHAPRRTAAFQKPRREHPTY